MRRHGWTACGLVLLLLLLVSTFALPVRTWRTGELPVPPLPLIEAGPRVQLSERIWVDTDAACGLGRRTDSDDCLALLLLSRSSETKIVGISTIFGNADLEKTDRVTRHWRTGLRRPAFRASRFTAAPLTRQPRRCPRAQGAEARSRKARSRS